MSIHALRLVGIVASLGQLATVWQLPSKCVFLLLPPYSGCEKLLCLNQLIAQGLQLTGRGQLENTKTHPSSKPAIW